MGAMSIWHWIILLLIVVLLFGKGKISDVMSDVAKGIKSFKKGMSEDESKQQAGEAAKTDPKVIEGAPPAGTSSTQPATDKSNVG